MFTLEESKNQIAKIKVLGLGGGGCNAISNIARSNLFGIELIAINTDKQHLDYITADTKLQIGSALTRGLGSGGSPEIGEKAAWEDAETLVAHIEGADMLFITAGMGGGTGTGASTVIASIAKEMGILTIAIVTTPFFFEGKNKASFALDAIAKIRKIVDATIVISNDKLIGLFENDMQYEQAFSKVDDILCQAVQGITDIIVVTGGMNVDFADVKSMLTASGRAVIGMGSGSGDKAAVVAFKKALSNPLFDTSIEGAESAILNITGDLNLSFNSIQEISGMLHDMTDGRLNLKLGIVKNEQLKDTVLVTIIAAGFERKREKTELPGVPKWTPIVENKSRAMQRLLEKTLPDLPEVKKDTRIYLISPEPKPQEQENDTVIIPFPVEDTYDIPTFMRKKSKFNDGK